MSTTFRDKTKVILKNKKIWFTFISLAWALASNVAEERSGHRRQSGVSGWSPGVRPVI